MLDIVFKMERSDSGFSAASVAPEGLAILVTAFNFSTLKSKINDAIEFYADGEPDNTPYIIDIRSGNYCIKYI